jgi:hypothetical protein
MSLSAGSVETPSAMWVVLLAVAASFTAYEIRKAGATTVDVNQWKRLTGYVVLVAGLVAIPAFT